jgi:hypothetical protein
MDRSFSKTGYPDWRAFPCSRHTSRPEITQDQRWIEAKTTPDASPGLSTSAPRNPRAGHSSPHGEVPHEHLGPDTAAILRSRRPLHIFPFREDGTTYGTHLDLVGRRRQRPLRPPYNGPRSRWYQAAMSQKAGRIHLGTDHEITFAPADDTRPGRR